LVYRVKQAVKNAAYF